MKKFSLFPHFVSRHYPDATCNLYLIYPEVLQTLQLVFPVPTQPSQDISQPAHVVPNIIKSLSHSEHSEFVGPVHLVQAGLHFLQVDGLS